MLELENDEDCLSVCFGVLGVFGREREPRFERERKRLCGVVLVASLSRYFVV